MNIETKLIGGICGHMWMPHAMAGKPVRFSLNRERDRFSTHDATMRDILLHILMENGGDFQNALFTADTEIVVVMRKAPNEVRRYAAKKIIPLERLKDCADLIAPDTYVSDFEGE